MHLPDRLRAERERLGLTQSQFAAIGGASKRSQAAWEAGTATPNAAFLEVVAKVGVDVQYVITGRRAAELLSSEETNLLMQFRSATPAVRSAITAALAAGSVPAQQIIHGHVTQAVTGSVTQRDLVLNVGAPKRRQKKL